MKVLVTGASGRIGANIVRELVQAGHTVRAAIRPGSPRAGKLRPFEVELVEADLLAHDALAATVKGMDAVVHNGVVFTSEPARMVAGSVTATAALLEAARTQGCARFVFISSTSVYEGTAYRPGNPIREEEAAPEITNVYGASKLAAEALCHAYHVQHAVPAVSLRLPMVVAGEELLPRGFLLETWHNHAAEAHTPDVAANASVALAWEAGKRIAVPLNSDDTPWKRHFCDVRDAAIAVLLALEADEAPGRAYNIASEPIDYAAAAVLLHELTGWESAEIPAPDDYRYEFSLARAKEFLGFRRHFSVREMIPDAWRHHEGALSPNLIPP